MLPKENYRKDNYGLVDMTYDCSLKQVGDAYFMEIGCISRNDENNRKHSLKMSVKKKRKMATILLLASDGKEVSLDKEL